MRVNMYYSLVIRANESLPMPPERMFEGTDPDRAAYFMSDGKPDLLKLFHYPIILTKEFQRGDTQTEAVIGYMDEPSMNPRVSQPILKFPSNALIDRGIITGRYEESHTHWAVHEGDPYRLLVGVASRDTAAEEMTIIERQVAVMMPFKCDAIVDPIYQAMRRGADEAGFECVRVDQLVTPTDITNDIRKLIAESRVVIADLSGQNSNVMYELGFAHGRNKKVILVSSDPLSKLPFDIHSYRTFSYQENESGLGDLTSKVSSALKSLG